MYMKMLIQQTIQNRNWTNIPVFLEKSIAYQNQKLSSEKLQALLYHLKRKKRRMIVGFIAIK